VRGHKRFSRGKRGASRVGRKSAIYGNYDTVAFKRTSSEERGSYPSSPEEPDEDPKTPSKNSSNGGSRISATSRRHTFTNQKSPPGRLKGLGVEKRDPRLRARRFPGLRQVRSYSRLRNRIASRIGIPKSVLVAGRRATAPLELGLRTKIDGHGESEDEQ